MDIYRIKNDYLFKGISSRNELIINQFDSFRGQSLVSSWEAPIFELLENVTKVNSEKKEEERKCISFDSRCYGNIFIINSIFSDLFKGLNVELLPINIVGIIPSYLFVNVLNVVGAIDFSGLDYKQSMDMVKSNDIRFVKEEINEVKIFRDQKIINFYYCTEEFKEMFESKMISGILFEKVGIAR